MKPEEFVSFLGAEKASAILRTPHGERAVPAMEAALAAGFKVCEYTLTIPGAFDCIRETSTNHKNVVVGAGTVLTEEDARSAVDAGARFLVSPIMDPKINFVTRKHIPHNIMALAVFDRQIKVFE